MKRAKLVTLSKLSQSAKIKRIVNVSTELAMMAVVAAMAIYFIATSDPRHRLLACLGTFVAFCAPLTVELIRGKRFTFVQHILLEAYMFFTMFLGSVLFFHHSFAPFDEISHVLFGYFSCIAIFYACMSHGILDRSKCAAAVLIIFFISMGTSALWEMLEFSMDVFFGENSMGFPTEEIARAIEESGAGGVAANIESLTYTSVIDTATDMLLHAAGTVVFMAQYLIFRLGRKNMLLGSLQKEVQKDEMNTSVSVEQLTVESNQNAQKSPLNNQKSEIV